MSPILTNRTRKKSTGRLRNTAKSAGRTGVVHRPFAKETRLLKITGDTIRESDTFMESPTLLGPLGDYLIFNVDAVWQRKAFLFGIKYK